MEELRPREVQRLAQGCTASTVTDVALRGLGFQQGETRTPVIASRWIPEISDLPAASHVLVCWGLVLIRSEFTVYHELEGPNWDHLLPLEGPDGVSPLRLPLTHPPPLCRQGRTIGRRESCLATIWTISCPWQAGSLWITLS
ncbi:small integral membrane protein 11 isoform X2 [Pan paniscus]|uniref:small integral membrane protein 11 isoform X2 n=1 Tax=Pan paniscus TaxID=9597 RepID=UPI0015614EC4